MGTPTSSDMSASGRFIMPSQIDQMVLWKGRHVEVAIPKSLEALVRRKVEEGQYSTEDEVVAIKRDRLRDALERGYQDVAAGRVIPLDTEKQIDELFAGL